MRSRITAVVLTALLVSACSSAESPSPSAAPESRVIAAVGGICGNAVLDEGKPSPAADGVQRFRNGRFVCTVTADDARVAGTETAAPWDTDLWRTSMAHGAMVQWGSSVRTNDGGGWDGQGSGIFSTDRGDIIAMWYQGTGGYGGLTLFELWTGTGPQWKIEGLIVPGTPPSPEDLSPVEAPSPPGSAAAPSPVLPSSTPPAATFGPMTEVAGTWEPVTSEQGSASTVQDPARYRDGLKVQIHRMNDPRVSGTVAASWNDERWETQDQGAVDVQWGTIRLDNAGGAWIGTYTGIHDGPAGDVMAAWYRGTGNYSGFGYFELVRGDSSVQGQIFPLTSPDEMPV